MGVVVSEEITVTGSSGNAPSVSIVSIYIAPHESVHLSGSSSKGILSTQNASALTFKTRPPHSEHESWCMALEKPQVIRSG